MPWHEEPIGSQMEGNKHREEQDEAPGEHQTRIPSPAPGAGAGAAGSVWPCGPWGQLPLPPLPAPHTQHPEQPPAH